MLDLSTHITPELTAWAKSLTPEALTTAPDWIVDEHCQSQVAPPELEAVLHAATEEASREAGVPLYPVNSFLRRYERGAVLKPHTDRTENEWTASLRLYHEGPEWPLHTADGPLTGDTVFMRSHDIEHWRDPLPGHVSVVGLLHWSSRPPAADRAVPPPQPMGEEPVEHSDGHQIAEYVPPTFVYVPQVLRPYQIQSIYNQSHDLVLSPGLVNEGVYKPDQRDNLLGFLDRRQGWQWLYDALAHTAETVNRQYWRLDVTGPTADSMQFTRYEKGGRHDWHMDKNTGDGKIEEQNRSVSLVLLLKDADYGGGLEFEHGGVVHLNPGDAIVAPSTATHRALPVGEGVREVLVFWLLHP